MASVTRPGSSSNSSRSEPPNNDRRSRVIKVFGLSINLQQCPLIKYKLWPPSTGSFLPYRSMLQFFLKYLSIDFVKLYLFLNNLAVEKYPYSIFVSYR